MREPAIVVFKNYKREPGWYWFFGFGPFTPGEETGKCGPYRHRSSAARSAKLNGFDPVARLYVPAAPSKPKARKRRKNG